MDKFAVTRSHGSAPLHRLIADELRAEIAGGRLAPGAALPSEHELMRRFGVSRGTVRQARAALRADGVVSGGQGRRLAVNPPTLIQPLSELVSFSAWAQSLGKQPAAQVLARAFEPAGVEAAAALHVPAGSQVLRLVRLRLADGTPLMIERTYFVETIGRHLDAIDLAHESIYAALAERGIAIAAARHRLSAIAASRPDARLLGVAAGAPLLRVRRLGLGMDGRPLEWADDCYRGDLVDFAIENSAENTGVIRRFGQGGD